MKFLGLNDFQFKDQHVLLRLDLNAPIKDGAVTNDERLVRSLPTINHILNNEGKLIVISHLGRPKENGELQPDFSLSPVVKRLEQLLNRSINLITDVNNIPPIETGEMIVLAVSNISWCFLKLSGAISKIDSPSSTRSTCFIEPCFC